MGNEREGEERKDMTRGGEEGKGFFGMIRFGESNINVCLRIMLG